MHLLTSKTVTRYIVGLKREESDAILNLLYNHIATGIDFQARVKWSEKAVVVWDVSAIYISLFCLSGEISKTDKV